MSKPITTLAGYNRSGFGTATTYPTGVPVRHARVLLESGDAIGLPVYVEMPDGKRVDNPELQGITRISPPTLHAVMSSKYAIHQHTELLDGVAHILGDDSGGSALGLAAVGMQDDGATAWLSVSLPDSATTASGVEFSTYLLAYGSMNGRHATTFALTSTLAICNNAIALATRSAERVVKVRHTSLSLARLSTAQSALGIVVAEMDSLDREIERLCATPVSRAQWTEILDVVAPVVASDGSELPPGRSRTMAENRREMIGSLYTSDARCAQWAGTAFGAFQSLNTYGHWHATGTGSGDNYARMRNRIMTGDVAKHDGYALDVIERVLSNA